MKLVEIDKYNKSEAMIILKKDKRYHVIEIDVEKIKADCKIGALKVNFDKDGTIMPGEGWILSLKGKVKSRGKII